MPTASIAPRPGSSSTSTGVPVYQPSTLVEKSWSAPGRTPASMSSSRRSTPVNVAVEMRSPPTVLDTQASVTGRSCSGRDSRSSKVSVSSVSTIPWMRSDQSCADSTGTRSAVSMR
jgi:hypothetical protein